MMFFRIVKVVQSYGFIHAWRSGRAGATGCRGYDDILRRNGWMGYTPRIFM